MIADPSYDHDKHRRELSPRRETGDRPPLHTTARDSAACAGWNVVERAFAWLHNFRWLRIRLERDAGLHYALAPEPRMLA